MMDYIDVTISTQSTWQDVLLYYFLSLVILFFLFIIKTIIEKRGGYIFFVFSFFIIVMFGTAQLFIVKYSGYHEVISMFINLNSEIIRVGSVMFSILYALVLPKKVQ
ncbi:hypothetical protein V2H77_09730 [Photorhabdus sp. P32]|uniref:Uncharacterized protein n=1 Tax=Photorhabdus luminescens subsp. mexicana TaxID=2100167 RepID=A0A4R4JEJ5_PHOLU|nr:hypothetical protein [Photorhabdus luminescens]TDB52504.1 hypothetical protein C5468_09250 [Photorhabdus luminescens subsp. mexicana]